MEGKNESLLETLKIPKESKDEEELNLLLQMDNRRMQELTKKYKALQSVEVEVVQEEEGKSQTPEPGAELSLPPNYGAQIPSYKYAELGVSEMMEACKELSNVCFKIAKLCPKVTATFAMIARSYPRKILLMSQMEASPVRMFAVALELLSHTKRLERAVVADPLSVLRYDYCRANVELNNKQLILVCDILLREFSKILIYTSDNLGSKSPYQNEMVSEIKLSCEVLQPVTEELKKTGSRVEAFSLDNVKTDKVFPSDLVDETSNTNESIGGRVLRNYSNVLSDYVTYLFAIVLLAIMMLQVYVIFMYGIDRPHTDMPEFD